MTARCVGGADALMRAAAVLCAAACGVARALCAGEEKEEESKSECEGGKQCPLPTIYGRFGEIVGARSAAHDLVTDEKLRPHDLRHDLLYGLTAARSAT